MRIDLPTLYYLLFGTLAVAFAMAFWERRFNGLRRRELTVWACAYVAIAAGCGLLINQASLPEWLHLGVANVLVVGGYAMMPLGLRWMAGRPALPGRLKLSVGAAAAIWLVTGPMLPLVAWNCIGSAAIAFVNLATVRLLLRERAFRDLRSKPLAVAIFSLHGAFYLVRAFGTPVFEAWIGPSFAAVNATTTMFEGVIYSVAAPMVLIALTREEGENRLIAEAQTDYLTGLDNRREFMRKAERILAAPCAPGTSVALLVFDLDHFKAINDTHGHPVGDEVLKRFAKIARADLRPDDVVARLGGEEFAILMVGTTSSGSQLFASHIARRFAGQPTEHGETSVSATVSVGLADAVIGRTDFRALMQAADKALYRAKSLGRDRVEHESTGQALAA